MNDASDAEKLHAMVLLLKMRARSTDELRSIWTENDRRAWAGDEIDAARAVLLERDVQVPKQKQWAEPPAPPEKQSWDDWLWDPFSEQRIFIMKIGCAVFGGAFLFMLVLYMLGILLRW